MSKIPENAKQVFKGVIFEVWQWPVKMYDGTTGTFERLKRPDTAVIIPVVGDKLIIQDQEQADSPKPFVTFPGGRCDDNEDPLDCAKRELLEETGYISDDWELWHSYNPVGKMVWTIYVYVARNCQYKQPLNLDPGEKIANRFITFDQFLSLPNEPEMRGQQLNEHLLRAKYEPEEQKKLHELLFKK